MICYLLTLLLSWYRATTVVDSDLHVILRLKFVYVTNFVFVHFSFNFVIFFVIFH